MLSCDVGHVHGEKRQKKGISVTIEDGMAAPDFELPDADGKSVKLSALKGHPVVVLFLPEGRYFGLHGGGQGLHLPRRRISTKQAPRCSEFLPTAPEPPQVAEKYALGVRLLSDEARTAAEAYGVWVEKSMYGRKYMGVERATFLIDKAGKVARSWRNVRVPGHAEEVLEAVRALKG